MPNRYIYEHSSWPHFTWRQNDLARQLSEVRLSQGILIGKMVSLGFEQMTETVVNSLTDEVQKSNEIEGERLNREQVRSSIARRLGIDDGGLVASQRNIDGVVEMMIDATQNYDKPMTEERLFRWHVDLFPSANSRIMPRTVAAWRDDQSGPMQVVSGRVGRQKVHFEAPEASRIPDEMRRFLDWFEATTDCDPLQKAAMAHLWFVTIHPFQDGNGRIGRAIADMLLARSEGSPQRFYSMSSQILTERTTYYEILESTQKGDMDITAWMQWFLSCLGRALMNATVNIDGIVRKERFWQQFREITINDRQRRIINMLLDDFYGKLTSSKWATITSVSQDTASRDIEDLVGKGVLMKDEFGGRSTSYSLRTSNGDSRTSMT